MTEKFISYAQHGEDVILWRALGDRADVTYVDVGAFHPTDDSVTRALYERGWRGVNIEPQPDRLAAFEAERPDDINLAVAIGDADGTITLTMPPNPGWATTLPAEDVGLDTGAGPSVEVPVRSLATLLPELGIDRVEVLKVDVEGAEPSVVRGLLDGALRPLVCVVEGVAPGAGRVAGDEAVALLVEAGYQHCLFDGLNHYLTTQPQLVAALSVPASPVDGYISHPVDRLVAERQTLHATIAALAAENVALRRGADALVVDHPSLDGPDGATASEGASRPQEPRDGTPADVGAVSFVADDSDLPLPLVDSEAPVSAPGWPALPEPALADLETRSRRRRELFKRLLRGERPLLPAPTAVPLGRLLRLIGHDHAPAEAVKILYQEILGRSPEPSGLAAWSNRLLEGESLLSLAHELARTYEAQKQSAERRHTVQDDLAVWASIVALRELGVSVWKPQSSYAPGSVAHEIFVSALYEVALHRTPTPDEIQFEVAKLDAGVGREWLLRAFAGRPEVRARFLGRSGNGLRGIARDWRNRRHLVENFRSQVEHAEARHVSFLLDTLDASRADLRSALEVTSSQPEER